MRTTILAVGIVLGLCGAAEQASAATIQLNLNVHGTREIDIPITVFPLEFEAIDSSWGALTLNGATVAYYVFIREDRRHVGSQAPSNYPDPYYRLMIRTVTSPTELLILEGSRRPLAEGGAAFGAITVATGSMSFLRNAEFTLLSGVLTITY